MYIFLKWAKIFRPSFVRTFCVRRVSLLFLCPSCYDSVSVSVSLSGHRHHHEKKKIKKLYIFCIDHYYFNRIDYGYTETEMCVSCFGFCFVCFLTIC